ncbi:MAG: hypothetical protein HYV05_06785 [Deltaproteobacteria bacterium]|nr:hypothetical protein [Deltaproteobacteria bacterium]
MTRMARRAIFFMLILLPLASWLAVTAKGQALRAGQPAPEITGGPWINSRPLTLSELKGQVVMVEFWTYG